MTANAKYKLMSLAKLPISRPRVSRSHLGLVWRRFSNPLFSSPTWRLVLLSLWCHPKNPKECIANPNHKHSKPKLKILRSKIQITKLDTEINRSGLSLNWSHSGLWWLLMMVMIWQKGWDREKTPERETDLAKGGKRERKNEGPTWWLLMMETTGVMVAACGGAMKGQWEERALGKRKKKMKKEKRQREEQVGERHYVMGQVIRVGPILYLILQKCH